MGTEIERKFLVKGDGWRRGAKGVSYRQGYLSVEPARTVRVRSAGGRAWLTIKGKSEGAVRAEFEFPLPVDEGEEILGTLCLHPLIEKTRYTVEYGGKTWEIDVFAGANAGLVVAEVELDDAGEEVDLPSWAGDEVTEDGRYSNAALVLHPWPQW